MRIPRFFACGTDLDTMRMLGRSQPASGTSIVLAEGDLIKQLLSVLRLRPGHKILLLDGQGLTCELVIDRLEKARVHCLLSGLERSPVLPAVRVRLGLSLIKIDRFEWCIEKLTELGVGQIVPVLTRNCVPRIAQDAKGERRLDGKLSRWQSIAREASEQCERVTVPPVVKPEPFDDFLSRSSGGGIKELRFICVERISAAPLAKALALEISRCDLSGMAGIDSISLLVGPEGGFTDFEIAGACEQEWVPVTLGRRILRSETAAIVAMAQVASVLDI